MRLICPKCNTDDFIEWAPYNFDFGDRRSTTITVDLPYCNQCRYYRHQNSHYSTYLCEGLNGKYPIGHITKKFNSLGGKYDDRDLFKALLKFKESDL